MVARIAAALRAALLPHASDEEREVAANLKRIQAIPYSLLPDMSAARDDLLALALAGKDVDAYQAAGTREWVIWCRPAHPSQNGRYSIEEWKASSAREYYRLLPDRAQEHEEQPS